jgi:hypothetical protein
MILGEILVKDLIIPQLNQGTLLQYVDDFLINSPTYELCLENTIQILNSLVEYVFKMSSTKVEICKEQVICLGLQLQ